MECLKDVRRCLKKNVSDRYSKSYAIKRRKPLDDALDQPGALRIPKLPGALTSSRPI